MKGGGPGYEKLKDDMVNGLSFAILNYNFYNRLEKKM